MDAIAKCPLCGKEPKTWLGRDNKTQNIECCYIFATGSECVKLWNKIAAAMNLVKADVDLSLTIKNTDDPAEIHKAMGVLGDLRVKALEVFGGIDGKRSS